MEWGLDMPSGQGEACDIEGSWPHHLLLFSLPRVSLVRMVPLAKRYCCPGLVPSPWEGCCWLLALPWPLCAFSDRSSCKCSLDRCVGNVPLLLWAEEWGVGGGD